MKYKDRDTKSFRENTEGMTFAQKLAYIWEYYKVWILTAAFVLFMAVSMGSGMLRNHRAMQLVQLGVLNEAAEQAETMWQDEATVISVPYFSLDVPVNLMLGARIASNELDVCLLPEEHVDWISNQEAIVPLEEILELPANARTLCNEETGEVLAVCINDTPFYRTADEGSEYMADLYLCVTAQGERLPDAVAFAQKIVDTIAAE